MSNAPERIWHAHPCDIDADGVIKACLTFGMVEIDVFETEYIRADLVPQWQPIDTMPDDGTVVMVWAKWDWSGMYGEKCDEPYSAQPAYYIENEWGKSDGIWSETFNPYENKAVGATHWMPTPTPPNEPKREP